MNRPSVILKQLRRAMPAGDSLTQARPAQLTWWELKELVEWIDHLEANQVRVMPVNEVPQRCEVLDNGEWRLRKPRKELVGRGLVAIRPPQKQIVAEDVVLAEMSFAMADDKEPTADDLGHGRATDIVRALREMDLLKEPDE